MSKRKNKKHKEKKQPSSRPAQASSNRQLNWTLGLVLTVLAFLLYSNTLDHGFTLDDGSAISENWVTKKGTEELDLIFSKHYRYGYWNSAGVLYRPLSLFMFAVEWEISPNDPAFHHQVNVFCYAATALLLFFTLLRIFSAYSILLPFAISLIFVVHPVHVEAVANIKSRDEVLAFFFAILALRLLWDYLDRKNILFLVAAAISYALALFSKESVITFLAIFPLTIYCFRPKTNLQDTLIGSLTFLLPAVTFLYIRTQILGDFTSGAGGGSPLDNVLFSAADTSSQLATAVLFLGKYLWTLLFPVTLCSDYGFNQIPITTWGDWRVLLVLSIHLAMAVYAVMRINQRDLLAYGIFFYGITLSIFSNILILIGSAYGERFLYAPSLGFAIVLALLILKGLGVDLKKVEAPQKMGDWFSQYAVPLVALALVAGLYGSRTMLRNPAWKDSYTLYTTDLPISPNSAKLNYHAALETVKRGQKSSDSQERARTLDVALAGFQRAIEIYPQYPDAYGELGLSWFRKGNAQKAMAAYQEALKLNPKKAMVYSNMGIIYFQQQNFKKAEEVYLKAVEYDPRFVDALRNLGSVYAMQKRFPEAITRFEQGLKYDPDNATLLLYLGSAHRDSGNPSLGQQYLERAYSLNPSLRPK